MRFAKYVLIIALFIFAMSVNVFAQAQEDTATAVTVSFEITDAWAIEATADDLDQTIEFAAVTSGATGFGSNAADYFIVTYTASSGTNSIRVSGSDVDWGVAASNLMSLVSMEWNADTLAAAGTVDCSTCATAAVIVADDVATGIDTVVNTAIYINLAGTEAVGTYSSDFTFEIWSD